MSPPLPWACPGVRWWFAGGGERSPVRWEAPGGAAGKTAAVSSREPSVQHHLYRCFFCSRPVEVGAPEPLLLLPQLLWEASSSSFLRLHSTAPSPVTHTSPRCGLQFPFLGNQKQLAAVSGVCCAADGCRTQDTNAFS